MDASKEIGETVREAVRDGWGTTARLSVLLLVAAAAAALVVYVNAVGKSTSPAPPVPAATISGATALVR